jgi:predicted O-methyltransferase YrrM
VNRLVIKYYFDLLSYASRNTRQAPGLLQQLFFDSTNRFYRSRVSEYHHYQRPLTEALTSLPDVNKDTIATLPSTDSLNDFRREIQTLAAHDAHHIPPAWDADITLACLAYYVCRLIKPQNVVETGVGHGITSAFILKALAENATGHLYSIDLPAFERGSEQYIGNAVPENLRDKWTLFLGLSVKILPGLLSNLREIGVFLHDSDHSYRNQKTEYNFAWKHLRQGGILLSDDVNNSNAFIEFSERQNVQPIVVAQPNKNLLVGLVVRS